MTSHEYAKRLRENAEGILSRPDVELGDHQPRLWLSFYGWNENDKGRFLATVRAFGSGTKEVKGTDLHFVPDVAPIVTLSIPRDKFCRKVQDEKWECEPLLSQEEEAQVG